jgi:hypothetical protein
MRPITFPLIGVARLAGVVTLTAPPTNQEGAPIFVTDIPAGYRDWRLISVAHEEGNFHSFSAFWAMIWRSRPTAKGRSRSQTAPSLPLCITVTCRRRKTTRSLAKLSLSYPAPQRTFSLWSRTQKSMPQRAAGVSLTSRMANLAMRRS